MKCKACGKDCDPVECASPCSCEFHCTGCGALFSEETDLVQESVKTACQVMLERERVKAFGSKLAPFERVIKDAILQELSKVPLSQFGAVSSLGEPEPESPRTCATCQDYPNGEELYNTAVCKRQQATTQGTVRDLKCHSDHRKLCSTCNSYGKETQTENGGIALCSEKKVNVPGISESMPCHEPRPAKKLVTLDLPEKTSHFERYFKEVDRAERQLWTISAVPSLVTQKEPGRDRSPEPSCYSDECQGELRQATIINEALNEKLNDARLENTQLKQRLKESKERLEKVRSILNKAVESNPNIA